MNKKRISTIWISTAGVILAAALIFNTTGEATTPVTINMTIPAGTFRPGDDINVSVTCSPNTNYVKGWECSLSYNQNILQATRVTQGGFFSGYTTYFHSGTINNTQGKITDIYDLIIGQGNVTAWGKIFYVKYHAAGYGKSDITFYDAGVVNETKYLNSTWNKKSIQIYSPYDMNADKTVNTIDYLDVAAHYGESGTPGWIKEDVNDDGYVENQDLALITTHWGPY